MRDGAGGYQLRTISREYNWDMLRLLGESP